MVQMNKLKKIILMLIICSINSLATLAQETLILEHEFDGYYFPYNFKVYSESDDDRYFYPVLTEIEGNRISLLTYNEDYTIRDSFTITFPIPSGYKATQVSFSSSLKLGDGTPFCIVNYTKENAKYGSKDYAIAYAINTLNGNIIYKFPSCTGSVTINPTIFEINNKSSLVVTFMEYDWSDITLSATTKYRSAIYSMAAKTPTRTKDIKDTSPALPIHTFNLDGIEVTYPQPGSIVIEQFPDGTTRKILK